MVLPLEPQAEKALRSKYSVLMLCGSSMIAAVFVYGAVAWILISRGRPFFSEETAASLKPLLTFLGALSFAALTLVDRFLTPTDPRCRSRDLLSGGLDRLYSRFLLRTLVRLGLAESLSLYGLVFAMATLSFRGFLTFAIPSAALMLYCFPRYDCWAAWVHEHLDEGGAET